MLANLKFISRVQQDISLVPGPHSKEISYSQATMYYSLFKFVLLLTGSKAPIITATAGTVIKNTETRRRRNASA